MKAHKVLVSLLAFAVLDLAYASETITYSYDAQGRLVTVVHTGAVNNNVQSSYTFDNADNRANVTVTNANSRVVVVPLGTGFDVIPITDP